MLFWGALENGCAFISETLTFFGVTGENTGRGSQHMMADDDERKRLEEMMQADTAVHLLLMLRTLQGQRDQLSVKYDYATLESALVQNIFCCAVDWSEARETLVRQQLKAA